MTFSNLLENIKLIAAYFLQHSNPFIELPGISVSVTKFHAAPWKRLF